MACDFVNLRQFVVDLRSRHPIYWNKFTAPDHRVNNSKRLIASMVRSPCQKCTCNAPSLYNA
eukprot:1158456-Pelagomonas_calceolata.AAC.11